MATMSPLEEAKNPRPRSEVGSASKKPKTQEAPFSDPKSLVTFIVGPDPTPVEFLIHRDVVCRQSSVLAAAFSSGFVEGQTQTHRLEETSTSAFRLLMEWFYAEKLSLMYNTSDYVDKSELDTTKLEAQNLSLAELWVLADKFAIPALQDTVIDSMERISAATLKLPMSSLEYIYQNTAAGSPLRRYVVHICAAAGSGGADLLRANGPDMIPPKMWVDIAKQCFTLLAKLQDSEFQLSISDYHVDTGAN